MKDTNANRKSHLAKDLLLPILIWMGIVIFFLNIKHLPFDFSEKDAVIVRFVAKVLATIALPLLLIFLFYKEKHDFGIYFPAFSDSLKLSWRSFMIGGPACMTFLLIALLGWSFDDWPGAVVLSAAFLLVFYLIPKVTRRLPTRKNLIEPNKQILLVALLSVLTLVIIYLTYATVPVLWKILYYTFIVGFGEELLFRGYLQSAMNRYFGKTFIIGNVSFGWGLVIAAALFGLTHALVSVPPAWPWALWTFIFGLTLGFIREKDGSVIAAGIFHAMMDMPLAFMS